MSKIWNSKKNTIEEIFELPKGSFAANFGFLVEQSVSPDQVLEAAGALTQADKEFTVASQAGAIVAAQKAGVAFQDWAPLQTC